MFGLIPFRTNNFGIGTMENDFEEFLNSFFADNFFGSVNVNNTFKVDMTENKDNYAVRAYLPNVNKEDINLQYENNNLIISARMNNDYIDNRNGFTSRIQSCGECTRSLYIDNVDENNIRARYVNNELQIILPKLNKEVPNKTKIDIE